MFTQLNPPMPLHVLGKGDGLAVGMIDYGPEHSLIWVTAIDGTGEMWCAPNAQVRMQKNWTLGRPENPAVTRSKGDLMNHAEPCADCADLRAAKPA